MFIRTDQEIFIRIEQTFEDQVELKQTIKFNTQKEAIAYALKLSKKIGLASAKDEKTKQLKQNKANRLAREDLQGTITKLDISGIWPRRKGNHG